MILSSCLWKDFHVQEETILEKPMKSKKNLTPILCSPSEGKGKILKFMVCCMAYPLSFEINMWKTNSALFHKLTKHNYRPLEEN